MAATPKFSLGRILVTPGVLAVATRSEVLDALRRHVAGDWGDVSEGDRKANDGAMRDGSRLLSAYTTKGGVKFWIVTEVDRSSTTVLLPDEY